MDKLFADFCREKEYLSGLSPRTIQYFKWTFDIWKKRIGAMPDKQNIKEFVIQLQQSGISPATTNSYMKGVDDAGMIDLGIPSDKLTAETYPEYVAVLKKQPFKNPDKPVEDNPL
jgi:hypothetical protein